MARKILLADDSVTAQNMGKKILSDAGYEVATVSNGSAALKRVQENPPDLIVLDVYMPGYSGLEVCRRLKESASTAHIPVLLTVGKLEPFKPDEARKARAEAFVVKPFEASELLSMVQRLETDPPKVEPKPSRKKKGLAEVFASAAIVEAPDPNAEIDEAGWRDRLSIPHKAHQEPDEAPEVATWGSGSFRDLTPVEIDSPRRDSPFTAEPFVASSIPPTPQDATAEEIAALQAAAAALMGGGDAAVPVAKAAPAEAAPVPAKDVPPFASEISSTTSEAQAASAKEAVVPATTPVTEPVAAATETKSAEPVAKTTMPLVEEAGVIDQSEEPLFAGESAPKAQTSSPSTVEEVSEKKLEPVPVVENERAPEEAKKETEAIPAAPVPAAPVGKKEEPPEQEKKADQEVASAPGTPIAVAQEKKEEAPEAEKKKTEEAASAPLPPAQVSKKEEETPETEKKKAKEETTTAPAPAPVAKDDEAPKKDKKKSAKKEERRKEPEPVPVAVTSTLAVSQRWVAHPLPLEAIELSLALDREMAQFRAAAAAVEAAAYATASTTETALAVAEPEPQPPPAPAEASKPAVHENAVPAAAEVALAAAVGAGAEARPDAFAASAATPEKPIAEAEMDRRSAAEMKAAWANWREIRESIVGSNMSQQVVDLASSVAGKSEASPEEDSEKSAGDPTAIANIVDSVLAELKPKIVEEIAKKLKKP